VTTLVLLDHARAVPDDDALAPITTARPLAEVRAGARLIRERWSFALSTPVHGVIAARRLLGFDEPGAAPVLDDETMLDPGTIVASSHFAPALVTESSDATSWVNGSQLVASRLTRRTSVRDIRALGIGGTVDSAQTMRGWTISHPWDLIGHLPAMLADDTSIIAAGAVSRALPADVRVIGAHQVMIAPGAVIEPFVVFDATQGAIVIESHALVRSFSRITGPFVLGAHSHWLGGAGHTVSVGDHCKVHGEVSTTIVCGHANKGHDGFVGHSYLGRWTNLGAGTVTSNLKNTYGPVSFNGEATGLQFLGSLVGDHAKTGILTRLTTGSCIGAGANVISDDVVRNVVPPFSFGSSGERYERDRFFETAVRVMARRQVTMSASMRACLQAVYDRVVGAA
jgi:UDP-N-acetylglucosamine diphosphorylase / glucose-1-phosphate thymidylyltransferase / UDP-N-acetylgalactosamine diphosphorylase / glucosamine-1-phosphate N-acetyltransferase / galactosamine-1-phosphate N-acetyltransferase